MAFLGINAKGPNVNSRDVYRVLVFTADGVHYAVYSDGIFMVKGC